MECGRWSRETLSFRWRRVAEIVAEVTGTFDRMRTNLQKTQRELLDAERLATIGRMASSISHDLRHSLAAVVANAEFLCESTLTPSQREDLYAEIRIAVNQMTDLIESLLEFSRTRESLRPSYGDVRSAVDRAAQTVKAHPEPGGDRVTTVQPIVAEPDHHNGPIVEQSIEIPPLEIVLRLRRPATVLLHLDRLSEAKTGKILRSGGEMKVSFVGV